MSSAPRVAYLLTTFPSLSETFVLNEVAALEEGGLALELYSYKQPVEADRLNPKAARYLGRVEGGGSFFAPRLLLLALWTCLCSPVVMGGILFQLLRHHLDQPLVLAKCLAILPKTLAFGHSMRRQGIERLHCHFGTYSACGAWVIHRLHGIPYSFTVHAHDIYDARNMLRLKMDEAVAVVCNSEYNRRFLLECYPDFPPSKLPLVRTGIHLGQFRTDLAPTVKERSGPARILAVGRLDPTKGYRHFIRVVDLLRQRGVQVEAHVIGHVTQEAYIIQEHAFLMALVKELELEGWVTFHQGLPYQQLLDHYRQADLFLLPCVTTPEGNSDGLPSVLVEAAAAGLPLVSTRISGIPELVENGVTGFLLDEKDEEGLARACARLVEDPALAQALARGAQERVLAQWDIQVTSRQMRELLAS